MIVNTPKRQNRQIEKICITPEGQHGENAKKVGENSIAGIKVIKQGVPTPRMIKIVESMKEDPLEVDKCNYGKGHK